MVFKEVCNELKKIDGDASIVPKTVLWENEGNVLGTEERCNLRSFQKNVNVKRVIDHLKAMLYSEIADCKRIKQKNQPW